MAPSTLERQLSALHGRYGAHGRGGEGLSLLPDADLDMPASLRVLRGQLSRFEILVFDLIGLLPPGREGL